MSRKITEVEVVSETDHSKFRSEIQGILDYIHRESFNNS